MTAVWTLEFSDEAKKTLRKLPAHVGEAITDYLEERVVTLENPKILGKPLVGKFKGLWRYRVGNYRIICQIRDETITVLVLDIGHRKDIYR